MIIDLSHVGPKTSTDAISISESPVTYTHCCPTLKKTSKKQNR